MRSTFRPLVAVAVGAVVAATVAGCGSAPAAAGSPVGTAVSPGDHDQAVKFAECMRDNGITAFPDPDASGQLTIDAIANGASVDVSSAAFTQAVSACKDLQPPGFTGHERNAQDQEHALAFAKCIRDNGVRDFPDPGPDDPLVDTNRIPSAAGTGGMSALNAAMKTCGDVIADQLTGP